MTREVNVQSAMSFGYIKDGKVLLKGYFDMPDRIIGDVRESEEASLQYFLDRFQLAEKKVEELVSAIETAENKGSYLMKLIHMRTYLSSFDGLGDFIPLFAKLDGAESYLNELILVNKQKNLEIKTELVHEMNAVKDSFDWKPASEKMFEVRDRWIKTGKAVKEADDVLEQQFRDTMQYFFERRNKFYDDRQKMYDARMNRYSELLDALKAINPNDEHAADTINKIKDEWKDIGEIPVSRMRRYMRDFSTITRALSNIMRPERRKPVDLTPWLKILEKAEVFANGYEEDAAFEIKKLQAQWKELGFLPADKKDEFMNRFRVACDRGLEWVHLVSSIIRRYDDFLQKPLKDQLKIQISQMRYLLKRDQTEGEAVSDTLKSFVVKDKNDPNYKINFSKLEMLNRRIASKLQMLKEFDDLLKALTPEY